MTQVRHGLMRSAKPEPALNGTYPALIPAARITSAHFSVMIEMEKLRHPAGFTARLDAERAHVVKGFHKFTENHHYHFRDYSSCSLSASICPANLAPART